MTSPDSRYTTAVVAGTPLGLQFTVFITGAAVLVLELLGSRFLSPHFGNNLYVWSAIITVTLAALALGYWIGGRLADSRGTPALLDGIIAAAAIFLAAVPPLTGVISGPAAGFHFEIGVLITATVCFGAPLLLLGMVSPLAIRLATPDVGHVGRSAGSIYASSTAGSIVGAIATGFILLPRFSASHTCYTSAWLLLALAGGRWLSRSRGRKAGAAAFLVVMAAAAVHSTLGVKPLEKAGPYQVLMSQPSFYGPVHVVEAGGYRFLLSGGVCQNIQLVEERRSAMPYVGALAVLPYLRPSGDNLLLIGLGAGDLVQHLRGLDIHTTAVEVDPAIAEAAFDYFGLSRDELTLVIGDGRGFLNRAPDTYDFIIIDAFAGGRPPYHLFSLEAFQQAKRLLRPGGILAVNLLADRVDHPLSGDVAATLKSVCSHLLAFTPQPGTDELRNILLFASDDPVAFPQTWNPPPSDAAQLELFRTLPSRILSPPATGTKVLTDDLNDIDLQVIAVERKLRSQNLTHLPMSLLKP